METIALPRVGELWLWTEQHHDGKTYSCLLTCVKEAPDPSVSRSLLRFANWGWDGSLWSCSAAFIRSHSPGESNLQAVTIRRVA